MGIRHFPLKDPITEAFSKYSLATIHLLRAKRFYKYNLLHMQRYLSLNPFPRKTPRKIVHATSQYDDAKIAMDKLTPAGIAGQIARTDGEFSPPTT